MTQPNCNPRRAAGQIRESTTRSQLTKKTDPTTVAAVVGSYASQKETPATSSQNNTLQYYIQGFAKHLADIVPQTIARMILAAKNVGQTIRHIVESVRHDYEILNSDPIVQEKPATIFGKIQKPEQSTILPKSVRWILAIMIYLFLSWQGFLPQNTERASSPLIEINYNNQEYYIDFDTWDHNCIKP